MEKTENVMRRRKWKKHAKGRTQVDKEEKNMMASENEY